MKWKVVSTETFSRQFQKHKRDGEFVKILDGKIRRLQENPENVGGYLSGKLHGYKSTRILKKLRLMFKIVKEKYEVYLMALDHRKFGYERFDFD